MTASPAQPGLPLRELRVLDLSRLMPGPMCSSLLADLGADVVKVEEPDLGDYAREARPRAKNMSLPFLQLNRNKRSIALDLTNDADKETFFKLVEKADVLLESFRPGVTRKLGIDFAAIKQKNARIIYCSITNYGQTGPHAGEAGHDINILARSGQIFQTGVQGGSPAIPAYQAGDISGAMSAAVGILAALQSPDRKARWLDISMLDTAFTTSVLAYHFFQGRGHAPERGADIFTGESPCYSLYQTKDGRHLAVGAFEYKFWAVFCDTIGLPELKEKHELRGKAAASVFAAIRDAIKRRDLEEWVGIFADKDACVTPVLNIDEAAASEHVRKRELLLQMKHETEGKYSILRHPVRFSDCPATPGKPAPELGQDQDAILQEWLS